MSEDRGFEVRDRRRVHAGNGDAAAASEADTFTAEPEEVDAGMPALEVTVQGVLRFAIEMLSNRAWVSMGLMPNPMTGKMERDLNEARRAIDVLGDLARHAEAEAEPEEKRDLRNMMQDLRVNFLRQSNQSG